MNYDLVMDNNIPNLPSKATLASTDLIPIEDTSQTPTVTSQILVSVLDQHVMTQTLAFSVVFG